MSLDARRTNYSYWKARMIAFLKSIDNKTWKAVISGWTPLKPLVQMEMRVLNLRKTGPK